MNRLLIFLKTKVAGYMTQGGTWVDQHYDKRRERKPEVKHPRLPNQSALNLFSTLEKPAWEDRSDPKAPRPDAPKVEPPPTPPPTRARPSKPASPSAIPYGESWEQVEAALPVFGAQANWKPSQRKKANEEAMESLFSTDATARKKLALYSGNGGIGDNLNEYYTTPALAASIWQVLTRLGLDARAHVLEPSSGTGVFQETKPAGVTMTAVELDETASRINRKLHPDDDVVSSALEDFVTIGDPTRYDAVVGNPPFGVRGAWAAHDKPDLGNAEEYFLDTCLDKTKDHGIVALVVPHGIATNQTSRTFRERILRKAEVVAAHRLPNTAFAHAGTQVVTDVLVMRKRPQDVAGALGTVSTATLKALGVWDAAWMDGKIFEDSSRGRLHGDVQANWRGGLDVIGDMLGVEAQIASGPLRADPSTVDLQTILDHLKDDPSALKKAQASALKNPYPELPSGSTRLINGVLYVLHGDPRRWHRADQVGELVYSPASKEGQALDLAARVLAVTEGVAGGAIYPKQDLDDLRQAITDYQTAHGNPSTDKVLAMLGQRDPRFLPLIAAVNADGQFSAMLQGLVTNGPVPTIDTTDFAAVMGHLLRGDERGVTVADIERHWTGGRGEGAALRALYASDQYALSLDGEHWGSRADLCAGDLYPKLDALRVALRTKATDDPVRHQWARQATWLEETLAPKMLEDFEVSLRAGWIPTEILSEYLSEIGARNQYGDKSEAVKYQVEFHDGIYTIKRTQGQSWLNPLFEKYLNRLAMQEDDWKTIPTMEAEFQAWLATSSHRGTIEDLYNRLYNGYRTKSYSGAPMEIPGWSAERTLNAYQYPALHWAVEEGKGILAYDVGLGKAQPLDAKLLTPTGWTRMGDIHVGDTVMAADGTPTTVLGVYPQGEQEIYRVTCHDGAVTECCDDHLWMTHTHKEKNNARRGYPVSGSPRVRPLSEIRASLTYRGIKNHAIPMVAPVQLQKRPVSLDPYVMGVLLGDGCFRHECTSIANPEPDIIETLQRLLPSDYTTSQQSVGPDRCPTYRIIRKNRRGDTPPFRSLLSAFGLDGLKSEEKFVPDGYKWNSEEVRLSLLQGLLDTDGYVDTRGVTVQFSSSSRRLADDVRFLAQSLGCNATIRAKKPTFTYKGEKRTGLTSYTVHLRMPPQMAPFRLPRKLARVRPKSKYLPTRYIVSVEPIGKQAAQCIRVAHPSKLYVTDDFIVTHNTAAAIALVKTLRAKGQAKRPVVVVPKSVAANWMSEINTFTTGMNVLVIGETYSTGKDGTLKAKSDSKDERDKKWHMVAQGNYDLILCTMPAFNDIDVDPIAKGEYLNSDFWVQRGDQLGQAGDKQVNKIRAAYEQAMATRDFEKRTQALYWNKLGVDLLIADEGHCFPAGTCIDGIPIEQLRVGDHITAFNHATGRTEIKAVTDVQRRVPATLVSVHLANGRVLICTGNHPVYTESGYRESAALTIRDSVYSMDIRTAGSYHDCDLSPQDRHRQLLPQGRDGSGWRQPLGLFAPDDGCQEGRQIEGIRVDRVEIHQPTSDGRFGGLCPEGLVYNIEVADHHNYFAEGILVHNCFKNLYSSRSRFGGQPKYLGGSGLSKRSLDMQHKARAVREANGNKGVFFLTATPTKNSPLEVYSMLSHIAPEEFERRGIRNSEDFIDRYCEIQQRTILDTNNNVKESPVVTGFKNMNEVRSVMSRYLYRKTADEVGLKIPQKSVHEHYVDMTPAQQAVYTDLREKMADVGAKSTGEAHIFSVMTKMDKAAMDLTLLGHEDSGSPKYDECVKTIMAAMKDCADCGQVIFADKIEVHQKIKNRLLAAGIPAEQIGIINAQEAEDSAARQNIAEAYVSGKLKIVIGNTATMGEGVNLQRYTSDIHHLDLPWEPSSLQQRNGRGIRQGNKREAVNVHTYLAKKSFDGYRYQIIAGKKNWMDQLWHGRDRLDNLAAEQGGGTYSQDDFMVMMAEDPDAARAQLQKNTAMQMAKYKAVKQVEAIASARTLIALKANYAKLENKDSQSAAMLKMRIARMSDTLQADEHLPDKTVLTYDGPMVLAPTTGHAFYEGATFEMAGRERAPINWSDQPSTWVVTAVDHLKQDVTMRPVGSVLTDHSARDSYTVTRDDLDSGLIPIAAVDPHDEIKSLIPQLTRTEPLRQIDPHVVDAHDGSIQEHLKRRFTENSEDEPQDWSDTWVFNARGLPEKVNSSTSPDVVRGGKFILPTPHYADRLIPHAAKEQREQAASRPSFRRRGSSRYYPSTPHLAALRDTFGWSEAATMIAAYRPHASTGAGAYAKAVSGRPLLVFTKGGPGSGDFGHRGRPGNLGGSQPHHAPDTGEGGTPPDDEEVKRREEIERARRADTRHPRKPTPKFSEAEEQMRLDIKKVVFRLRQFDDVTEAAEELRLVLESQGVSEKRISGAVELLRGVWQDLRKKPLSKTVPALDRRDQRIGFVVFRRRHHP